MQKIKNLFHKISYLQYLFLLVAMYFMFLAMYELFLLKKKDGLLSHINTVLIFYSIAISFSTLQDTSKVQNKISARIWESRKKGRRFLIFMSITVVILFVVGFIGYFSSHNPLKEISFGLIVLAIGYTGLLKAAMEMFEKHRKN